MFELHHYQLPYVLGTQGLKEELASYLNEQEREKAKRFIHEEKGLHFTLFRGLLRRHLGHHLQCPPQSIIFHYGQYGKPELKNNPLHFNVSHCREHFVILLSNHTPVGVDIEYIDPNRNTDKLAKKVFNSQELEHYHSLPASSSTEKQQFFFEVWTQKEAITKCSGQGLVTPFHDLRSNEHNVATLKHEQYIISHCTQHPATTKLKIIRHS